MTGGEQEDRREAAIVWVEGMARGDRSSLEKVFRHFSPALLAVGLSLLKSRGDAEEVLHEVFLEAWRKARSYDPARGSVKAWLIVRMRSRCLDRLKSNPRARHVPWEEQALVDRAESAGQGAGEDPFGAPAPDRAIDFSKMRTALAQVTEEQRQVLLLGYFEGLSASEMAELLHLPLGTVKSRIRMGLLRLKMILSDPQQDR